MEQVKPKLTKDIDLKKAFIDSLEDPDFRKLVGKYKIDVEIGMFYTSKLKVCLKEYLSSLKEHSYKECPNEVKGYILEPVRDNNILLFNYVPCSCHKELENEDKVLLFDVPQSIKEASLKNIHTDDKKRVPIIKYMTQFIKDYKKGEIGKGIYLSGSFGTGKTYLIAALFNHLAEEQVSSIIVHMPELNRKIKESFDSDYSERFELLKRTPLLLLDDIGAEYITAWSRDEVLEPIINYRIEAKLPTFFTSNYNLEELETLYSLNNDILKGRRIIDRIKHMTVQFELISQNRRK